MPFPDVAPLVPPRRQPPTRTNAWPVLGVALAAAADAWRPPGLGRLLWLDVAALACLAWALWPPDRLRATRWRTPVDGRVLAAIAVSALAVVAAPAVDGPRQWLRQILAGAAIYYALASRLRRGADAPERVWPAFAAAAFALGGHALWSATAGLAHLARDASAADRNWAAEHGLAKTLCVATVLCAGRAAERGTRPVWRVATVVGALGFGLHARCGGVGLTSAALARLEDPLYFSTIAIVLLVLWSFARMAWKLGRQRPDEAPRWRAVAVAFAAVAGLGVLGGTSGGEGLRTLAFLAGALVVATREAPAAGAAAEADALAA